MKAGNLRLLTLALVAALTLSGCTAIIIGGPTVPTKPAVSVTPSTPGTGTPSVPATGTPSPGSGTPTAAPTSTPLTGLKASAPLTHVPVGSAHLTYDSNAHTLQAQYAFTGLAPNSTHPLHIHGGHCASPGPLLYDLKTITADGAGNSSGVVTASNVTTDQPSSGWYMDLHNGTGSSAFDQVVLTCAAISGLVGVSGQPASGTIEFLEGVGPNMTATGYAQFVDQGGVLTVTVTAEGLEPGSTHPLFVRKGSCEQQSNTTFHGLYPLVANGTGSAKSTTQITGVSGVPSDSWYVIVYRGTNLDSYIDSAPILCGNVRIATPY
jgi:hypothetical protein